MFIARLRPIVAIFLCMFFTLVTSAGHGRHVNPTDSPITLHGGHFGGPAPLVAHEEINRPNTVYAARFDGDRGVGIILYQRLDDMSYRYTYLSPTRARRQMAEGASTSVVEEGKATLNGRIYEYQIYDMKAEATDGKRRCVVAVANRQRDGVIANFCNRRSGDLPLALVEETLAGIAVKGFVSPSE